MNTETEQATPPSAALASSLETDKLAAALNAVQAEIKGGIEKTGYNDFHSYDYVTLVDVVSVVRPLFTKHGLSTVDSVESAGSFTWHGVDRDKQPTEKSIMQVTIRMRVLHTSGQWIEVQGIGWGSNDDKAGYSAITGARKYAHQALLNLGGGPEDDPEHPKNETAGRPAQRQAAGARASGAEKQAAGKKAAGGGTTGRRSTGNSDWLSQYVYGTKWGKKGKGLTWADMIEAGPDTEEENYLAWIVKKADDQYKPPRERAQVCLYRIAAEHKVPLPWDREGASDQDEIPF